MNRRDFLRGAALGSMGMALMGEEITAHAQGQAQPGSPAAKPVVDTDLKGRPVKVAVIGLSGRGREILGSVARMGSFAPVTMLCDTFQAPVFVKKAQAIAPSAQFVADYKQVLDNKDVEAVFVATPTHKHKQIVLDALAAGKHVFCEAPIAHTIEDAKAIAQAAQAVESKNVVFQPGLQMRCNAQTEHVHHFLLSSTAGKLTGGRAQWHKRTNWRQVWPNPERESELNWRLRKETSNGLFGEVALHQLDTASWYFNAMPTAVTAFQSNIQYDDGRTVADNIQCVLEYPGGLRFTYDASLACSFDDNYELFYGSDATIMLRDLRGWMFKEPDSGQLGWEVFARKDAMQIGKPENGSGLLVGNGIALVADATKQLALGKKPGELGTDVTNTALYQSCRIFLNSVRAGKRVTVKEPSRENQKPPLAPGALEGYTSVVIALKALEAAQSGSKVNFQKEWFTL